MNTRLRIPTILDCIYLISIGIAVLTTASTTQTIWSTRELTNQEAYLLLCIFCCGVAALVALCRSWYQPITVEQLKDGLYIRTHCFLVDDHYYICVQRQDTGKRFPVIATMNLPQNFEITQGKVNVIDQPKYRLKR